MNKRAVCLTNGLINVKGRYPSSHAPRDLTSGKIYEIEERVTYNGLRYIVKGEEEFKFYGWEFYPERFKILRTEFSHNIRLL